MSTASPDPGTTASPAPLAALLPPPGTGADEILSRFMSYVAATGLELYPAQEEALLELLAGKHVVLNTPTGSGKSLVATALHFKALAEGQARRSTPARSRRWSTRSSSICAGCSAPSTWA